VKPDKTALKNIADRHGDSVKNFLTAYSHILQPLMFLGGFTYDSLTITRIDSLLDNLLFGLYLSILAAIHWLQIRRQDPAFSLGSSSTLARLITDYEKYFPLISQFLFGSLMSAYLIFYFQSAADIKSFLFLLLLLALLVGNEFFEKRYRNSLFFYAMYFFALFSWLLFLLPNLLRHSNTLMFYLALLLSTALLSSLVLWAGKQFNPAALRRLYRQPQLLISGALALLLALFYHINIIPPVPLSMKSMGIYSSLEKRGDKYHFQYQEPERFWDRRLDYNPRIYWRDQDAVYAFASVFAPGNLTQELTHHWFWQDPATEQWVLRDTISYVIKGGRAEGWRGYSFKRNMFHGKWRVDVRTPQDKLVGRIRFELVFLDSLHRPIRESVF